VTAFGLFLPYLLAILFGQLLSFRCYKIKMASFRHPSWRSSRCSITSGPSCDRAIATSNRDPKSPETSATAVGFRNLERPIATVAARILTGWGCC
jgi:hypothetical protein